MLPPREVRSRDDNRLTAAAVAGAALACAALVAVGLAVGGCGGARSEAAARAGGVLESSTTLRPRDPQMLAFLTDRRVGVVDGGRIRYVGALSPSPTGEGVDDVSWSGDGRQLAWLTVPYTVGGGSYSQLTMVDVRTGVRHTWRDVAGPLMPGSTGVVSGGIDAFVQYLPDGRSERYEISLSAPPNLDRTGPTTTDVRGAVPADGHWLVAAESSDRESMPVGGERVFSFDPQQPELLPLMTTPSQTWQQVARLDVRHVAWIDHDRTGECRNSDTLQAYRLRPPALPPLPDGRSWRIRRLVADGRDVGVLARATGIARAAPAPAGPSAAWQQGCDRGERSYRWLALRAGRWVEQTRGLVDLDVAADGRVAMVHGVVCTPFGYGHGCLGGVDESEYESLRFGAAALETPGAPTLALPRGTQLVRFSPVVPIVLRQAIGHGRALDASVPLAADGLGPLRFGARAAQLQAATMTPLRFGAADARGCSTMQPADGTLDDALGVRGQLRGGRLVALSATTRDVPADDAHPATSPLRPDVSAVYARGPRTDRGVRPGDSVDRLLARYGVPARTQVDPAAQTTDYAFRVGPDTLVAHVDGAAEIRRLLLYRGSRQPPCG